MEVQPFGVKLQATAVTTEYYSRQLRSLQSIIAGNCSHYRVLLQATAVTTEYYCRQLLKNWSEALNWEDSWPQNFSSVRCLVSSLGQSGQSRCYLKTAIQLWRFKYFECDKEIIACEWLARIMSQALQKTSIQNISPLTVLDSQINELTLLCFAGKLTDIWTNLRLCTSGDEEGNSLSGNGFK
jgi:hypothetical protein